MCVPATFTAYVVSESSLLPDDVTEELGPVIGQKKTEQAQGLSSSFFSARKQTCGYDIEEKLVSSDCNGPV